MRIESAGHAVFAATLIGLGILGLVRGDFAPIWNSVPPHLPGRHLLAWVTAFVATGCGLGLVWQRSATIAARALFAFLLSWLLLIKLPYILHSPTVEVTYQSAGMTAVLVAGAWVMYAWLADERDRRWFGFATGERGLRLARGLYGLAMLAFGLSHFFYLRLTAPLVPAFLPWHVGWAYFTGCAYLAAGAAILSGVYARLAAVLSTVQMGMFTALVWLPLMAAGTLTAFQWGEFINSWALTAAAWVVADSYRATPWFAIALKPGPA